MIRSATHYPWTAKESKRCLYLPFSPPVLTTRASERGKEQHDAKAKIAYPQGACKTLQESRNHFSGSSSSSTDERFLTVMTVCVRRPKQHCDEVYTHTHTHTDRMCQQLKSYAHCRSWVVGRNETSQRVMLFPTTREAAGWAQLASNAREQQRRSTAPFGAGNGQKNTMLNGMDYLRQKWSVGRSIGLYPYFWFWCWSQNTLNADYSQFQVQCKIHLYVDTYISGFFSHKLL